MARPAGGVQWGRSLYRPPRLVRVQAGAPAPILFISDLHLRPECSEMTQRALDPVRREKPALLLLGGDMSEYDEGLVLSLKALREAFPDTPAFAVPGNNDDGLFGGDRSAQKEIYDSFEIRYLLNDSEALTLGGRRVEIAGVEDSYSHTPSAEGLFSANEDAYRILLSHAPLSFLLNAGESFSTLFASLPSKGAPTRSPSQFTPVAKVRPSGSGSAAMNALPSPT